jgi:hypothetical protein
MKRIPLTVIVACGIIVGFHGGAAADDESASAPPASVTSTSAADVLENVAEQAQTIGINDPGFAGTTIDVPSSTVIVYRSDDAPLSPSLQTEYLALLPYAGAQMSFQPSRFSMLQLEAAYQQISEQLPVLSASGVDVNGWGPDSYTDPITVWYTGPGTVPPDSLSSVQVDGSDSVVFKYGTRAIPLDRKTDTSPFYGGDAIRGEDSGGDLGEPMCSGGFVFYNIHTDKFYMSTAWHCTPKVTNSKFYATNAHTGGTYMGQVTSDDPGGDVAFINLTDSSNSGAARIFNGDLTHQSHTVAITGSNPGVPVGGAAVYLSGATSDNHRDVEWVPNDPVHVAVIDNDFTNQSATISYYDAETTDNSIIAADGDSGGPAWKSDGQSGGLAKGEISQGIKVSETACSEAIGNNRPDLPTNFKCYKVAGIVILQDMLANHPYMIVTNFP